MCRKESCSAAALPHCTTITMKVQRHDKSEMTRNAFIYEFQQISKQGNSPALYIKMYIRKPESEGGR
jgi:hypothetical protein